MLVEPAVACLGGWIRATTCVASARECSDAGPYSVVGASPSGRRKWSSCVWARVWDAMRYVLWVTVVGAYD